MKKNSKDSEQSEEKVLPEKCFKCNKGIGILSVESEGKLEKAEKVLDKIEDNLVLCTIIKDDTKQVQKKKRVSFAKNFKFHMQPLATA